MWCGVASPRRRARAVDVSDSPTDLSRYAFTHGRLRDDGSGSHQPSRPPPLTAAAPRSCQRGVRITSSPLLFDLLRGFAAGVPFVVLLAVFYCIVSALTNKIFRLLRPL